MWKEAAVLLSEVLPCTACTALLFSPIVFYPEDGNSWFIQNVDNNQPHNMASL